MAQLRDVARLLGLGSDSLRKRLLSGSPRFENGVESSATPTRSQNPRQSFHGGDGIVYSRSKIYFSSQNGGDPTPQGGGGGITYEIEGPFRRVG